MLLRHAGLSARQHSSMTPLSSAVHPGGPVWSSTQSWLAHAPLVHSFSFVLDTIAGSWIINQMTWMGIIRIKGVGWNLVSEWGNDFSSYTPRAGSCGGGSRGCVGWPPCPERGSGVIPGRQGCQHQFDQFWLKSLYYISSLTQWGPRTDILTKNVYWLKMAQNLPQQEK